MAVEHDTTRVTPADPALSNISERRLASAGAHHHIHDRK
jgi:hypothetical protein